MTAEENLEIFRKRIDDAEAIARMRETDGWRIFEANLRSQLEAYVADNAMDATSWDDYLKKAGKIFGIRLVLVDLEDFQRQGEEAGIAIEEIMGTGTRP